MLGKAKAYRYQWTKEAITKEFYHLCDAEAEWIKALSIDLAIKHYSVDATEALEKIECLVGRLPDLDITPEGDPDPVACNLDLELDLVVDDTVDMCTDFSIQFVSPYGQPAS